MRITIKVVVKSVYIPIDLVHYPLANNLEHQYVFVSIVQVVNFWMILQDVIEINPPREEIIFKFSCEKLEASMILCIS